MLRHWFTREDAPIEQSFTKRFDPLHWTVDFPRGAMASVIAGEDGRSLQVHAEFLRRGDLVGLIFESSDRHMHPAHRRETNFDYSHCRLSFDWTSSGLIGLDAVNGPTLTIEGRDQDGRARSWFIRLWNYAEGRPDSARIRIDFDELYGGFAPRQLDQRVDPSLIDRLFISLVPPSYALGSEEMLQQPAPALLQLGNIQCEGSGSTLAINDAVVPEHDLRICTAYDDMYHLAPQRVIDAVERLGFRKVINHYVGMSHYPALRGDGLVDPLKAMNAPALAWHRSFAREAHARGYQVIWSLSYELLDMFCPESWKQRHRDGSPAQTGYDPPSTLVSPACAEATGYLGLVGSQLMGIAEEEGLEPLFQIGEPWWWVDQQHRPCLYDDAARQVLGPDAPEIEDVRGPKTPAEIALLDAAGSLLARSTERICEIVRTAAPNARLHLLPYLPGSLDPSAPELRRANLPTGWARPAFDVLQLEDYEWVTEGRTGLSEAAVRTAGERLSFGPDEQHYFSGFAATGKRDHWDFILRSADAAKRRGTAEVFIWALPQILRDGLTIFEGEDEVKSFDDVSFPIEIGAEASVAPTFSTTVITSASGHEFRNVNWNQARLRFDAGPGVRGDAELQTLLAFFRARRGSATAFRFQDPFDHSSKGMTDEPLAFDQELGKGDGTTTEFPLVKVYGTGERRRITLPVRGSVRVSVDGLEQAVGWELSKEGKVQFEAAPAPGSVVRAGFRFDVPVRFATDQLEINRASFRAGEAPTVPLIEVREFGE